MNFRRWWKTSTKDSQGGNAPDYHLIGENTLDWSYFTSPLFPVSISGFLIPFLFTAEPDYFLWEQCLKNAIITGLIEMYELDGPG